MLQIENRLLRRVAAVLLASLLLGGCALLSGCTAQSMPLGRRAMVRLIYLEKEGQSYQALTVVYAFSGDGTNDDEAGAATAAAVQTAVGETIAAALHDAAAAKGNQPFFAQNQLLLLGPQLAKTELNDTLDYFARSCGLYRDPAVWLWYDGKDALQDMADPMAFVQMVETLTMDDVDGCIYRVLESGRTDAVPVLPVLAAGDTDAGQAPARLDGLAVFSADGVRLYRDETIAEGYGLLCGRMDRLQLTVTAAGQRYTLQLERLHRNLSAQAGRLCVSITGAASAMPQPPQQARAALVVAVQAALQQRCAQVWTALSQQGAADVFALAWWARQLGADDAFVSPPRFEAGIYLE